MGAMFQGMNAYASPQPGLQTSDQPITVQRSVRLEKGPAYDKITEPTPAAADDWPAYRYDGFRSGITKTPVPAALSVRWKTKLPTQPSAVTTAAGKVFACDIRYAYAVRLGRQHRPDRMDLHRGRPD